MVCGGMACLPWQVTEVAQSPANNASAARLLEGVRRKIATLGMEERDLSSVVGKIEVLELLGEGSVSVGTSSKGNCGVVKCLGRAGVRRNTGKGRGVEDKGAAGLLSYVQRICSAASVQVLLFVAKSSPRKITVLQSAFRCV